MNSKEKKTFRPISGLSREAEEKHLSKVIRIAQENLEKTEARSARLSEELQDLMDTYDTRDKEALSFFHNTQSYLRENERELLRCHKARKKPYFGRIDFKDPKIPFAESYYVGRVGIAGKEAEPVVIDWRAPIASVYYENSMGHCTYTVENEGVCEIDLKRKRTYEIADDRLIDYFDSDIVANDELLTKYLAKNKNAVLGEIIATIQQEQNSVIRRSPKMNLIVQGAAGSGKTTVAMHRISYILYNYEDDFRPQDFYIIGSNRILLNYITSVLPDLDVYGVSQMTMEQLFIRLLYEDWDPNTYTVRHIDRQDDTALVKGSFEWFHDLEQFCRSFEKDTIPQTDIFLENGVCLMNKASVSNCLKSNPLVSMQGKINMLNDILMSRLENETTGKDIAYPPACLKELRKKYRRYFGKDTWRGSIFELYKNFLSLQAANGKSVPVSENDFDLYDLAALAYLYKRIKETDGIREASHVIIDEAQDFGMMAYGSLFYCLRNCTYTVMGDVSQNIHFGYGLNDWEDLKHLLIPKTPRSFCVLKKSYRNTVEISDFASGILRHGSFPVYPTEPVIRHGSPVQMTACSDSDDMIRRTVETIRKWQSGGRETIAVICRDEAQALHVSKRLSPELSLAGTDPETASFTQGIMVLPVEYTKGLEFDAVILYDPSAENYPAQDGYVKLLYVAATRALHELAVIHSQNLTDLIGKPAPDKVQQTLPEIDIQVQEQMKKPRSTDPARLIKPQALSNLPVNPSPHRFGSLPDVSLLCQNPNLMNHPSSLGIQKIRRTRFSLDLISHDGVLRLTPISESVIRVRFWSPDSPPCGPGHWNCIPETPPAWTAQAGKALAELTTGKLTVQIDRRSGALRFLDENRRKLLTESRALPRRIESGASPQTWDYFEWEKEEKLTVKGILDDDLERLDSKARYISFGGKILRMPLLLSKYGYGLGICADQTVMCCNVPVYSTFLYTEGSRNIDYYFLYGGNFDRTLSLYKELQKQRR